MPKAATRKADEPVTTGAMHGDRPTRRIVQAGQAGAPASTSAANSVFALGGPPATSTRGGRRRRLPALNAADLQVRTDLNPARVDCSRKGQTRYDDIFERLTHDGQCVQIPKAYKAALSKAATSYNRNHPDLGNSRLRVLTIDDSTAGVFRMQGKARAAT